MPIKNSRNSPLQIAEVILGAGEGRLGLTLCPGKKDASRSWDRDLKEDMRAIRAWGASIVVTLIERSRVSASRHRETWSRRCALMAWNGVICRFATWMFRTSGSKLPGR
jgi:hypothetical protein